MCSSPARRSYRLAQAPAVLTIGLGWHTANLSSKRSGAQPPGVEWAAVIYLLATAGAVWLLDQWSKRIVGVRIVEHPLTFGRAVRLRAVMNAKRSYQRGSARTALVLVWIVSLACATTLYASGATFQSQLSLWGVGAALGGAAGNLTDILRRRAVIDFIDLGWWPVFNVADVAIVAGLIVAFWPIA